MGNEKKDVRLLDLIDQPKKRIDGGHVDYWKKR